MKKRDGLGGGKKRGGSREKKKKKHSTEKHFFRWRLERDFLSGRWRNSTILFSLPFVILSSTGAAFAQRSALLPAFATNAKMSCAGHRALAAGVATAGIVSSSAASSTSPASPSPPAAGPRRAFAAAAAGFRNNHRLALGGIAALSASLRNAAAQVSGIT